MEPVTPVSLSEHMSALLDDEVGSFEQRRVLDELKSNDELSQKLSAYALIGEAMRSNQTTVTAGSSFLAGIQSQIESDADYHDVQLEEQNKKVSTSSSWLRPVGGFALAASVAAIAVIGFQNYKQIDSTEMTTASINNGVKQQKERLTLAEMNSAKVISAANMVADDEVASAAGLYRHADTRTRSLLKRYVDSHMQYASTAAFVPSVRVIAYAD